MPTRFIRAALLGLTVVAAIEYEATVGLAQAPRMPVFQVDPSWPKLPNNWVLGVVSAVTTDRRDHVWILHRPRSVPENLRTHAAPPVLEFDASGAFIRGWGGTDLRGWPINEHGITVDHKDNVWISGSGIGDDNILKFTLQGKYVSQIGARTQSRGNTDHANVNRPADLFVSPKTNELFVADGYGNRRVIVFDADTGMFKRMWAGFGSPPDSAPPAGARAAASDGGQAAGQPASPPPFSVAGRGPEQFGNPVHAIKISSDDLVYVADRANRRVQVFTPEGKYLSQVFINRTIPSSGTAAGIAFSADTQQQFLYVSDLYNHHVAVLDRKSLRELYQFGVRGTAPGDFIAPHLIAVDSKGNLYTAEVNPGNRAQRFVFKGISTTRPPNALTPAQLAPPVP
jgi:DNA-binding beta-propeller fold protein YncE